MRTAELGTKRKNKTKVSRDIGLEIGSICGKYFLDMDHLHYGYWTADLPVHFSNVHAAQSNYADFVISHIPAGVKTILDIGCGTGRLAKDLQNMGYQVDCISPNTYFAEKARTLLGESSRVFTCTFEEFATDECYDLVLFCESFQYIGCNGLEKAASLLDKGGHLLICDYFAVSSAEKSPLSGGERWTRFTEAIGRFPLEQISDVDITSVTAPTLDVVNDVLSQAVQPTVALAMQLVASRYPWPHRLIQRIYRRRIEKINTKYFSGKMTGETFKKFKTYRLLLYRKGTVTMPQEGSQSSDAVGCEVSG